MPTMSPYYFFTVVLFAAGVQVRISADVAQEVRERKTAHVVRGSFPMAEEAAWVYPVVAPIQGPALVTSLRSRCVAMVRPSHYTVCLFENVTQRDSNGDTHVLGIWERWSSENVMRYVGGDPCPNGVPRNATVTVRCGMSSLAVKDAEEPSMCSYALSLDVPIACDVFYSSADNSWRNEPLAPADASTNSCEKGVAELRDELDQVRRDLERHKRALQYFGEAGPDARGTSVDSVLLRLENDDDGDTALEK
ncbi:hypothetical protein CTAYLR_006297 [Chrysophaeum taylorii]|uniref:MRH domain-containing protein n=1 Tax=Chrysophaeum taylorii TaxID=2483200 RepID=A0AAD7UJU5_9STRA|nr:hypothetical protein CTAYLR_006297 [Chrysophaeum taylorii]